MQEQMQSQTKNMFGTFPFNATSTPPDQKVSGPNKVARPDAPRGRSLLACQGGHDPKTGANRRTMYNSALIFSHFPFSAFSAACGPVSLESAMSNPSSPASPALPKIGFVSLGCPKALVDSEQILTQLRAEGYDTAKSYDGADLVIVNTCGFIDAAVQESLDAIGEALAKRQGDRHRLPGRRRTPRRRHHPEVHPKVLAVTGPHAWAR
jgi:hypothetical protein